MTLSLMRTSALALPVLLGIGVTAFAAPGGLANTATPAPQCGVTPSTSHGMMTLEAQVLSPKSMTGSYSLAVQSRSNGGSTSLSQGGNFTVEANTIATVGSVSINAGARYTADFSVTIDGKTHYCADTLPIIR